MNDDGAPSASPQPQAEDLEEQCRTILQNVTERRKTYPKKCSDKLSIALKKEIQHLLSLKVELPKPDSLFCKPQTASAEEEFPPQPAAALEWQPLTHRMAAMVQRLQKVTTILKQLEMEETDGIRQFMCEQDSREVSPSKQH
ncbi:uncharacterized protein LOC134530844 [Bacillus rossius redtenbacheri]|uniref:uncharacterized protein LOC134530844 n=1 Tax=Bacillus rossius redtenbacheri TaxID=93214 RepID=UPI002FDE2628